jgi:hypothetical protein
VKNVTYSGPEMRVSCWRNRRKVFVPDLRALAPACSFCFLFIGSRFSVDHSARLDSILRIGWPTPLRPVSISAARAQEVCCTQGLHTVAQQEVAVRAVVGIGPELLAGIGHDLAFQSIYVCEQAG